MKKRLIFRDEKTGRFCKRHKQKYIRPELISEDGSSTPIGNYRRGVDEFDAWSLEKMYAAPEYERQPDLILRSFKSLHRTLLPVEKELSKYKLVDVEIDYGGERIVRIAKLPLRRTGEKKKRRSWGRRTVDGRPFHGPSVNMSAMEIIRKHVKRALEEQGFAITSKETRARTGDKRTRTLAVDKKDERGRVVRKGLKTIKPRIVIRGYM